MTRYFVTAFFHTLTMLVLGGTVISYAIAYRLTKPRSKSVLSIMLFLIAVLLIVISGVVVNWKRYLGMDVNNPVPFPEVRAVFLFLTSGYFLYTTWFNKLKE